MTKLKKIPKIFLIILVVTVFGAFGVMGEFIFADSIQEESIPLWIKNTAGWWSDDSITTTEYINSLEFLIDENIIQIASAGTPESNYTSSEEQSQNLQELLKEIQKNKDAINNLNVQIQNQPGDGNATVTVSSSLTTYTNTKPVQILEDFTSITEVNCDSGDLALSLGWSSLSNEKIMSILPETSKNPESITIEMKNHPPSTGLVIHILCADTSLPNHD